MVIDICHQKNFSAKLINSFPQLSEPRLQKYYKTIKLRTQNYILIKGHTFRTYLFAYLRRDIINEFTLKQ